MPHNYVFQSKTHFLEMAHTNFVSSIRYRPSQHLICTKNNKKHISEFRTLIMFFFLFSNFSKILNIVEFPYVLYIFIYLIYYTFSYIVEGGLHSLTSYIYIYILIYIGIRSFSYSPSLVNVQGGPPRSANGAERR